LRAISIAVDPLSEKYVREAQPAQQMIQLPCKELTAACQWITMSIGKHL